MRRDEDGRFARPAACWRWAGPRPRRSPWPRSALPALDELRDAPARAPSSTCARATAGSASPRRVAPRPAHDRGRGRRPRARPGLGRPRAAGERRARTGWCASVGEREAGVASVSAPVLDGPRGRRGQRLGPHRAHQPRPRPATPRRVAAARRLEPPPASSALRDDGSLGQPGRARPSGLNRSALSGDPRAVGRRTRDVCSSADDTRGGTPALGALALDASFVEAQPTCTRTPSKSSSRRRPLHGACYLRAPDPGLPIRIRRSALARSSRVTAGRCPRRGATSADLDDLDLEHAAGCLVADLLTGLGAEQRLAER